jgi:hypothetical protein
MDPEPLRTSSLGLALPANHRSRPSAFVMRRSDSSHHGSIEPRSSARALRCPSARLSPSDIAPIRPSLERLCGGVTLAIAQILPIQQSHAEFSIRIRNLHSVAYGKGTARFTGQVASSSGLVLLNYAKQTYRNRENDEERCGKTGWLTPLSDREHG